MIAAIKAIESMGLPAFAPAGEVGTDTHRAIESRIERGVAAIDFGGAAARAERVDYAVAPIVMDVRQRRVGAA